MIADLNLAAPPADARYDTCIIGSGPAGMTLALRLAAAGQRVAMIEAGGMQTTAASQEFYAGHVLVEELPAPETSRLRQFGGTTGHWEGRCEMLDPADFEPREDVPLSGWPIGHADLAPYAEEAARLLGTPRFARARRAADDSGRVDVVEQQWSSDRAFYDIRSHEPVRFGRTHAARVAQEARIAAYHHAACTGLEVDGATGRVTAAQVRSEAGVDHTFRAATFVLAMGGLETARFLLHLNAMHHDLFGNQGDMVGRCFMEHPSLIQRPYFITRRLYSHQRFWGFESLVHRSLPELVLSPSIAFARGQGILHADVRLMRPQRQPLAEEHAEGAEFVRGLVFDRDYFFTGLTWVTTEQAPDPSNRVVLMDDIDRYGMRRIGVHWRLAPREIETLRAASLEAALFLIRSGLGRMRIDQALWERDPNLQVHFGNHHMGTARMATSPESGVVDAECRVHGSSNLYVAGSAVFPTSGYANPTFPIVQMSLRLADHLAARAAT